jgi:predicted nucleic acid-binding protein
MRRAAYVEKVLDQLAVYPFDRAAARTSADLGATLQKRRIQIGVHDVMIAATALSLGFLVTTLNVRDYEKIEGLALAYGGRDG